MFENWTTVFITGIIVLVIGLILYCFNWKRQEINEVLHPLGYIVAIIGAILVILSFVILAIKL